MKRTHTFRALATVAMLCVASVQPAFAQTKIWPKGISPYAEGPSGRWNLEKQGPPPRGTYDYRHYPPRERYYHGGRLYYRDRHYNPGAAILGGIILGLGTGIVAGQTPPHYRGRYRAWSPEWYAYCSRKYRSFNPRTGYFLGYDGKYHFCR